MELVAAVDCILQLQVKADTGYFAAKCGRAVDAAEAQAIEAAFLRAYRWQHPFGRPAPAFRQGAFQPDHRRPGPAHPSGARDAPITWPITRPERLHSPQQ